MGPFLALLLTQLTPANPASIAKYTDAVNLIRSQKYGEATALLNELSVVEPKWAEVFAARCSAQLGLNQPGYAERDCAYALRLKPELAIARYSLATAERKLGKSADAARHFREYASMTGVPADLRATALQQADALDGAPVAIAPPPPPPAEEPNNDAKVQGWITAGAAVHDARRRHRSSSRYSDDDREPSCLSSLDCGSGEWCKDRGDGRSVCMGNGGGGDSCSSNLDCGRGWCKDRGDGRKVCMDNGRGGDFCSSNLDCGHGLWCREVGDFKRCAR